MFEELSIVELTHDIKKHKLKKGDSGTVVLVYKEGKAYEVEFVASNGRTIAVLTLMPDDIRAYVNKDEYFSHLLNAPISLGTVAGMIFTKSEENIWRELDINQLMITTETPKSNVDVEEHHYYPTAVLWT